ncbi:MAG TPA: serine protease [Dehalococcoidia bacterium]
MRMLGLLAIVFAALLTLNACGGDDDGPTGTPSPAPEETQAEVSIADLARSVVQIQALSGGDAVWWDSGTILSADGLILTNAHVVDDRYDEYDTLAIGITRETDEAPEAEYLADVVAVDFALDLAVVQITETSDGSSAPSDFPFVRIGDSDALEIGDDVRILGYPGIGGETITFTDGSVSGFTAERSVGNRAWIKTDATIAGGNSGGLAVNNAGEIIGVPTVVGSGAGAETGYVDCRVLEDTNNDGALDDDDTCVTVGGFINGLRPVGLAANMIAAAEAGEAYVSPYHEAELADVPVDLDSSEVELSNLLFSPGVTSDDGPTEILALFPSGSERVCGFWDYEGMQDGMTWDALWYVDGELNEGGSVIADTWVGGESGNWWVCILDEEFGLPDGPYELVLQIEGSPTGSDAVYVDDDRQLVEFDIVNESSIEVCYVWASPADAQNWGFEDLGPSVTVPPGDFWPLFIATGTYDLLMYDCNADTLIEEYGVDVVEDSTYTVTSARLQ